MITPEMTISYPHIFKPAANDEGILKYSCQVRIDKSDKEGVAKLKAAVDAAIAKGKAKKWDGKKPFFKNEPLRDGDDEIEKGIKNLEEHGEYVGKLFFSANRKGEDAPPGIVDKHGQPLMDQSKLYAGCVVRLDVNPYPYSVKGNHGVAWYLNNIMVVRDGERLDGTQSAENAFAAYASDPNVEEDGGNEDDLS